MVRIVLGLSLTRPENLVIFDWSEGPSSNDATHKRVSLAICSSPNIARVLESDWQTVAATCPGSPRPPSLSICARVA